MLNARFVPIESWPGNPTFSRKRAQFRAKYVETLDKLEFELEKLRAKDILIQAYFKRSDIRNDGWPKNTAKPTGVGVIVSFDSPKGPLSFPCDTFTSYEDNLRAIALALEALRAVDRYGVTRANEQYKGWAQLPPPSDQPFTHKEDAARFLHKQAYPADSPGQFPGWGDFILNSSARNAAYRIAAKRLHPDANGGSHELFVRLQAAVKLLELP